jgi:hypothetical protein
MKLYKITDWARAYETHETRKLAALRWVPIPNAQDEHDAHSFNTLASANNAISRIVATQAEVKKSVIRDFAGVDPLRFEGHLHAEEYLTTCAE